MSEQSSLETKAQLDKAEREHLEDIVTDLRETVEADIEYQLKHTYELNDKDGGEDLSGEEVEIRPELVTAVQREDDDKSWEEKFERYVMGVGYTVVNRLTALRCMEVRGFIDRPVTQFGDSGTTPAAEKLENEKYLGPDEAKIEAYDETCRELTDEIEILFDPESPYSIVDPDVETFEELCRKLDEVPDAVWRADDVLGWVYEYYNTSRLEEVQRKARESRLEIEDVPIANQFYTPHWVVRSLTDNSLGKLYLESTNQLESAVENQDRLSISERVNRGVSITDSPNVSDICTYLVEDGDQSSSPDFTHPSELRVIDPACGSGHFLLYAFDILERIWRNECPEVTQSEIPKKILENNLFGVDIDLRACQIAAFSLYLKARERSEQEGGDEFDLPEIGIVCADARVVDSSDAVDVFDQVAENDPALRNTLKNLLDQFEDIQGLGSLLKVRDSISEEFLDRQAKITDSWNSTRSLSAFLDELHETISEQRNGESFLAQDLRSFLKLLQVLSQDYDVALMNPPYGARKRMPKVVADYIEDNYEYGPEYYINFFEVNESLLKDGGRIGMIVPRTFMFKSSFNDFREDFIGSEGIFDFLAEYGNDVLDNATVRTTGTVVRVTERSRENPTGTFFRLHDVDTGLKEETFVKAAFSETSDEIPRKYVRSISEFGLIPGSPISYWASRELRTLYDSETVFDADNGSVEDKNSLGEAKVGIQTGNNERYVRKFWEAESSYWVPFAKGGKDAWIMPNLNLVLGWGENGKELKRFDGCYIRNEDAYFQEALTWTYMKAGGRRFGYLHPDSVFGRAGPVLIPENDIWDVLSYTNSALLTYLMICQTPDRQWEVGNISKLPWQENIINKGDLGVQAREIAGILLALRGRDMTSPHYIGPALLEHIENYDPGSLFDHSHRPLLSDIEIPHVGEKYGADTSISELSVAAARRKENLQLELQQKSDYIDEYIFDLLELSSEGREEVLREIALRTNDDPRTSEEFDPSDITEPPENFEELIKDLLLHLVVETVQEDSDGVVPIICDAGEEERLLNRLEEKFENIFDEFAQDRLAEVDQQLGNKQPEGGAYPNIQDWIQNDLFNYHLNRFENTPILWRLTTERLVSDPQGEAFACLVDYRQLDTSLFDRIESRYLEPLKNEYRTKRNAADQRRSDSTLSTTEQAEAAEEYERYESALAQIDEFQEAAVELSSEHPRDWVDENQTLSAELAPKVAKFRNRTEERLETLDQLVDEMESDEFEDLFSPTFLKRVNENKDEWIDALEDLETACRAYSKDANQPVEAHLYDLFSYFDALVGSTHYGSNGIFFMNYYFSKGEQYLDDGEPRDGLEKEIRLLAELAAETDKDVELGKEIEEDCNELSKAISSDWQERALAEVLTSGYDPVKKHGVAINIQPLAKKKIVPEIVEDKVIN